MQHYKLRQIKLKHRILQTTRLSLILYYRIQYVDYVRDFYVMFPSSSKKILEN
jgi:hypothetical protein